MNVLIPMAGAGSRFAEAGYKLPKPLIDVEGAPMIQRVVENLGYDHEYVFIIQREHEQLFGLAKFLRLLCNCRIVYIEELTQGAAATCLLAEDEYSGTFGDLFIANCDQIIHWDQGLWQRRIHSNRCDGSILTFIDDSHSNSYAKLQFGSYGKVIHVAEKDPISQWATCGAYWWRDCNQFFSYAHAMINKNIRTNNEFYVAPVYNEAIGCSATIDTYLVDSHWPIGTPEDLTRYLRRSNVRG